MEAAVAANTDGRSHAARSVQSSVVSDSLQPVDHSTPGLPVLHPLPEFTQTAVMPYSHLILCRPLLLLPPIPPSIRVSSNESVLRIRWPKYWSFSFSISPSNEYSVLISFRIDWFDLRAVQGTLKSLLQHHSSTTSILQRSTHIIVHLSHPSYAFNQQSNSNITTSLGA